MSLNIKHFLMSNADYTTLKSSGQSGSVHSRDRSTNYQNEPVKPCYFSSSIYYGGQEVYSTNSQSKNTYNAVSKTLYHLITYVYIIILHT